MIAALLLLGLGTTQAEPPTVVTPEPPEPPVDFDQLTLDLEALAMERSIPGLSVAVVHALELVWSQGIGFADIENEVLATPHTRYRLASCSKPMAAVVVMQLVEAGELSLDAPMSDFWIPRWFSPDPERYHEQPILLRHVLTHTSEWTPGEAFSYSGNIFADVTFVLEQQTGQAYTELLEERIFTPAGMTHSSPGHTLHGETVFVDIAPSYAWDGQANVRADFQLMDPHPELDQQGFDPVLPMPPQAERERRELLGDAFAHLNGVCTSSGIVSTVVDMARFDIALDQGKLLSEESRRAMWTPMQRSSGERSPGDEFPYGIGWFVGEVEGLEVLWHYGWLPPGVSALYVKVPARELSFFLLSNTDRLSTGIDWNGGLGASPFARACLAAMRSN